MPMLEQDFRYVFGPVLSGRLGRSLGLDLLGARICSMNCVYCESGPLARLTVERAPYVPAEALREELAAWEAQRKARGEPAPDAVTLGGLGEPTLNSDLPRIIADARAILPGVPVAVLTNASLMTDPAVREELRRADIVLPSLDALRPEVFRRVNRGHPSLDSNAIADGIAAFKNGWEGKLYLEVLLVQGVNDSPGDLADLAVYCERLQPDRVDVTTLSRPGTEAWARAATKETLDAWRSRLGSRPGRVPAGVARPVEKRQECTQGATPGQTRARILASLARRPQTPAQLSAALLVDGPEVARILAELVAEGLVEPAPRQDASGGGVFYQAR
jgi:wyosine [tRNA(Phe)-imidazoG37] synthetase (radical SAM superfamily)